MQLIAFPALLITLAITATGEPSVLAKSDESTGAVSLSETGRPILNYNYKIVPIPEAYFEGVPEKNLPYARKYAIPRSNYLHPLFGPDGQELTSDWNKDHAHHRGIYWAWPEVQFNGEMRDLHALQRVWARPTGEIETHHGDDWAELEAENRWMWEDKTPIVRELATIRAWKKTDAGRFIDLTFRFEALEDGITLARRGTDAYGGLNIRLAPIQNMDLLHHADPPEAKPRMAWQGATGVWEGSPKPLSMIVFEKSDNPAYPGDFVKYPDLPWFQPAFPRAGTRHPLLKTEALVLSYRIWIRSGPPPTGQELRKQWSLFQSPDN